MNLLMVVDSRFPVGINKLCFSSKSDKLIAILQNDILKHIAIACHCSFTIKIKLQMGNRLQTVLVLNGSRVIITEFLEILHFL